MNLFHFYQIRDLLEASKTYETLEDIIDRDVKYNTVRSAGSHSRNLRRVRQGLDLIRVLFEQFLSSKYVRFSFVIKYKYIYFFFLGHILECLGLAPCSPLLLLFSDFSLREAASTAYSEVCAPYHTWAVRAAVSASMYALPVREQLLLRLNEDGKLLIPLYVK